MDGLPPDLQLLADEYAAVRVEFEELTAGWTEAQGAWRENEHSWSVAEHLEHLAMTGWAYLSAMDVVADRARAEGKVRRGPAKPGFGGRLFGRMMEPPVRPFLKFKAPKIIVPVNAPPVSEALAHFTEMDGAAKEFLVRNADTELNSVVFKSPFAASVSFSVASGLNILATHSRRHLWHARRVREAGERVHFGRS
jgi:hypothetical protein